MTTETRIGEWMQTYTGRRFWVMDPRPEDICIEDIAHHLSLLCRYNGACKRFYSVAQHSVLVCDVLEEQRADRETQLWGLLHDAAEAYIGDMVRPLADKTLARITAGRQQHGDRFLIAYYGAEVGGRSLDKPLGTIGTVDTFAVIDGDRMRMLSVQEMKLGMGFPADYKLPATQKDATKVLGNAVPPPLARGVLSQVADRMTA